MNLKEYQEHRKQVAQSQAEIAERILCPHCRRGQNHCLCSHIVPFDPTIKIVLLMHPMEAKKERVGTGRLAHLTLENSEIIVGVDFTDHQRVNRLISENNNYPVVLYPGENSLNITEGRGIYTETSGKNLVLFVIDGTWPCAKKMMTLSTNLHPLPRVCFTPRTTSAFSIKQQPHELCVSTIEALYIFLDDMQNQSNTELFGERHGALLSVLKAVVDFQTECAANPALNGYRKQEFKKSSAKKVSKKWESRSIFFRD